MDLKSIRGCGGVKIAQVKYKGFCCFSWELVTHYEDV